MFMNKPVNYCNRPNGSNYLNANKNSTIRQELTKAWDVFISSCLHLILWSFFYVSTVLVHNSSWKMGKSTVSESHDPKPHTGSATT